ncbi:hypothetical protein Tco_0574507, partial [Tanacetum coccineum]
MRVHHLCCHQTFFHKSIIEVVESREEDDDEEDEEIEESTDYNSVSEDVEDEGPT